MKKVYLFLLLCVCIQLSWGQDRATEIRNTSLIVPIGAMLPKTLCKVFRIALTWGLIWWK